MSHIQQEEVLKKSKVEKTNKKRDGIQFNKKEKAKTCGKKGIKEGNAEQPSEENLKDGLLNMVVQDKKQLVN